MAHFLSRWLREPDVSWHLVNDSRGTTVATHVEGAFDSRSRRHGLLGREALARDHALIIAPSNAVHSWFMRFPIDVVFVDRAGTVLRLRTPLSPWRIAAAWGGFAVVELAAESAGASRTAVGDRLALARCE